jgi:ribosome-associated toxin RatA of RatAB toxin-antitoxin module
VIVTHSAERMFRLVDTCEEYPQFLPGCAGAEVYERTEFTTHARLDINYKGFKSHVATRNTKEPFASMHLAFSDGPFERLHGHWKFDALGEAGCRVEFTIDYTFTNRALEVMLGPIFGQVIATIIERFVQRADAVDGKVA